MHDDFTDVAEIKAAGNFFKDGQLKQNEGKTFFNSAVIDGLGEARERKRSRKKALDRERK